MNLRATWSTFQPQALKTKRTKKKKKLKKCIMFFQKNFFPHFGMIADRAAK